MADFLDYIAWRGDLSFEAAPFCEVDNLVFSEIVYADMDGIAAPGITVSQLASGYKEAGRDQSALANDPADLLEAAGKSVRFGGARLEDYVNEVDVGRQIQFAAVTFVNEGMPPFIAFRGTDNTIVGWREDFALCYLSETPGQKDAVDYLEAQAEKRSGELILGGHSKGGNLAVYAAAFCNDRIKDRIAAVYSDDGPGFNDSVISSPGYAAVLPKVRRIIPESSLIGVLLSNGARVKVVKSTANGLWQHDPHSWEIRGTAFEEADGRSVSSILMDETLSRWMNSMDRKQREGFVTGVFDALEASGALTLAQLNSKKWIYYNAVLRAALKLEPSLRSDLTGALKKLAAAGREVLWNEAKRSFEKK